MRRRLPHGQGRRTGTSLPAQLPRATRIRPFPSAAAVLLLGTRLGATLDRRQNDLDDYTRAHLSEARLRIEKAVDAGYVINAQGLGGGAPDDPRGRPDQRPGPLSSPG